MEPATPDTMLIVLAVCLVAAVAALVTVAVAAGILRRGAARLTAQLHELRRHPLVGEIPPDPGPALASLAQALNALLSELRAQVRREHLRAAGLQSLADGPSDIALIGLDGEWRVAAFNRGATRLTGWSADEILAHHVEILFAPGEWERLLPKLARRSLRDEGIVEKVRLQRRQGDVLSVELSVEGGGENAAGDSSLLLVARDLTNEEELERRLRGTEERYRRLVEESRDGALILKDGCIAYSNPALARLLAIERDALRMRPFKEIVDTRDLLSVLEQVRRAESGEELTGEFQCRLSTRHAPRVDARLAWAATEYEGGRALFATVVDLTERARFEKVVAESEARLRATLDASGDGILVLGEAPGGQVVSVVNPAICEVLGLPSDRLLGLPETDLWGVLRGRVARPDDLQTFIDQARTAIEARHEGVELAVPARAILDLVAGPVRAADGRSVGLILTARDVTPRVEGEHRLKRSLDELSQARGRLEVTCRELAEAQRALSERNRQLEQMNNELRSLDEMKSNLLANVSHELHTPLVSIKGYTEMIVKRRLGPLTQEQERGLSVALKNIDRLIEMIDNLLSFARMEKGDTQLTLEDHPLWQLVDEAIEMVGERVRKKNLSVTTQYESENLMVRGDRVKLEQVFTNLLTNAVKFNREGGRIMVSARRARKGFAEVRIADTGIGIPQDEQRRIFERFHQVDAGPGRRYEGTGIGLSIVRDLLRLHGCSIRVESEPGKGSVFSFTLPLARVVTAPTESRRPASRGRGSH